LFCFSITGHPAIFVPYGFTREGLPVGAQIVGRHQDELGVLQLASAFQEATQFWKWIWLLIRRLKSHGKRLRKAASAVGQLLYSLAAERRP